jgi:hypothetical protein
MTISGTATALVPAVVDGGCTKGGSVGGIWLTGGADVPVLVAGGTKLRMISVALVL